MSLDVLYIDLFSYSKPEIINKSINHRLFRCYLREVLMVRKFLAYLVYPVHLEYLEILEGLVVLGIPKIRCHCLIHCLQAMLGNVLRSLYISPFRRFDIWTRPRVH